MFIQNSAQGTFADKEKSLAIIPILRLESNSVGGSNSIGSLKIVGLGQIEKICTLGQLLCQSNSANRNVVNVVGFEFKIVNGDERSKEFCLSSDFFDLNHSTSLDQAG